MINVAFSEGYVNFRGINCIYSINNGEINLIPANRDDLGKLHQLMVDQQFLFCFENDVEKNCIASIDRVKKPMGPYYTLVPRYILKLLNHKPITSMQLTCSSIDEIFHPADYYYMKTKAGMKNETDLAYEIETADKWTIKIDNTDVDVCLQYGGILNHGIASDRSFHPRLIISFEPTNDIKSILIVYCSVTKFLQIAQYNYNFGECKIRLQGNNDDFNSGWLFDLTHTGTERGFYNEARYRFIRPYIKQLLQFAADNTTISLSFLPDATHRYHRSDYTPQLLVALFAAFEDEYKANISIYETEPPADLNRIKKATIDKIRECSSIATTLDEKSFLTHAEERIKDLGNQTGQNRKVKNVIKALHEPLISSATRLFPRNGLGSEKGFNKKDIERIAEKIVGLRAQVSHENSQIEYDDYQVEYIRFLEILVYSQMLKRAEIDDAGIELLIGLVFNCNSKYMDSVLLEVSEEKENSDKRE